MPASTNPFVVMRIVSLLPAATEWVACFGGLPDLVGRSHACDAPPGVQAVPALTHTVIEASAGSAEIDAAVRDRHRRALSLFEVDLERLRALRPDVVLTQAQCDVCAVPVQEVEAVLAESDAGGPRLFSFTPTTLREALQQALHLARAIGRLYAAIAYLGRAEQRLQQLRDALGLHKRTDPARWPSVVCIEWLDPLMVAGHWLPEVAEMAGARVLLGTKGTPSAYVSWDAIRRADPDVLAILPCGFSIERTRRDLPALTAQPGWDRLRAVRSGRVFLFDGSAYFNRPGPRLYRAIELLAAVLHPAQAEAVRTPIRPWEMQPL